MRENIGLFHGKRKDNGAWVEGYLYITHNGEYEIGYYNAESNIERMTYIVIPETIGECTSVPDKNGKLIFEGDIVKVEGSRHVYEVRWNETLTGYWYYRSGCFFSMLTSNCEVIGTIYDVGIKNENN